MRNVKGSVLPKREVPCSRCGVPLLRAVHFVDAVCERCRREGATSRYRVWLKVLRRQARQFRIVCHVVGWEPDQFVEMLAEMKRSPMSFRRKPEGRAAVLDFKMERRAKNQGVAKFLAASTLIRRVSGFRSKVSALTPTPPAVRETTG